MRFARLLPAVVAIIFFGCSDPGASPPDAGQDAGQDAGGLVCSCPCQQIVVTNATHCWTVSCEPYCGPGSGNAC